MLNQPSRFAVSGFNSGGNESATGIRHHGCQGALVGLVIDGSMRCHEASVAAA